jgi:hypothetical protein
MSKIQVSRRISIYEDGHRLQAWISESTNNIPNTLFVYQKIPFVPYEGCPEEMFVHIASYSDIYDFPETYDEEVAPFFRRGYIDLKFNSLPLLEQKWVLMENHLQHTVEDIVRLNSLPPTEVEFVDIP